MEVDCSVLSARRGLLLLLRASLSLSLPPPPPPSPSPSPSPFLFISLSRCGLWPCPLLHVGSSEASMWWLQHKSPIIETLQDSMSELQEHFADTYRSGVEKDETEEMGPCSAAISAALDVSSLSPSTHARTHARTHLYKLKGAGKDAHGDLP